MTSLFKVFDFFYVSNQNLILHLKLYCNLAKFSLNVTWQFTEPSPKQEHCLTVPYMLPAFPFSPPVSFTNSSLGTAAFTLVLCSFMKYLQTTSCLSTLTDFTSNFSPCFSAFLIRQEILTALLSHLELT